ncbi:MAG: hypothetical protein COX70_00135 [Flavobacteriales bacterium CG_4_10_14_0_2_um_filter_32_8]|nr:MAG: hypothetical protein COX70_00135 [Flavobacteriales bacterium CG_4_10_14_0_2_um_filter_32_8]PJB15869.1 MAG: hypothetical protein CO118_01800 [Flavobacteriales bacterium CG_4_9_14_3_um_filter_32_8]
MKKGKLIIILLLFPFIVYNQTITENSFILSGTVVDGLSNQPLVGGHLLTNRNIGTKTDELGEFTIIVYPKDTLKISYIGFKTIHYMVPYLENGKYLIKFKLFTDSIALAEIQIFPWPTYDEFKQAFVTLNKQEEQIKMEGVKMYQDRNIEPWEFPPLSIISNPISFLYDKLLDKRAKLRRRLERNRNTIRESLMDD